MNNSVRTFIMRHYDCKYYLNIDVFKGICKRDKIYINADDLACDSFRKAQKCKYCFNYSGISSDLGNCMSKYEAFPEMNAVTCNDFKER
jgi:4-hydroxyphenylacetate decarboxylase small subunit